MGRSNGSSSADQTTISAIIARICERDPECNGDLLEGSLDLQGIVALATASYGIDIRDIVPDAPAPTIDRTEAKAKADLRKELARRLGLRKYADQSTDELKHQCIERNIDVSDLFPGDPPAIQAPTPELHAQPNAPIQQMECRVAKCRQLFHPGYEATHLQKVHGITPDQVGTHTRGCIFGTCFKMFSSLRERNAHMDREHADVTLVRCPHPGCEDERFHNEAFLQTHLDRKHHGQLPQPPAEGDTSDMTATAAATPATPAQTAPPAPATPEPIVIPLEGGEDPIFPFQPPDTGDAHVVTTRRMIPRTTAALGATTPAAEVRRQWPPVMHSADEAEDTNGGITPFSNWPRWPTDRSEEALATPQVEPAPTGDLDDIVGMSQKDAFDWLDARNWKRSPAERVWSDDEPLGVVFDYRVFNGMVTIHVSKGPAPEETRRWRIPEFPEMGATDHHPKPERVIRTSEANALPPIRAEVLTLREDQEPETVEKAAKPSSPPANNGGGKFLGGIKKLLGALAPPSDLGN